MPARIAVAIRNWILRLINGTHHFKHFANRRCLPREAEVAWMVRAEVNVAEVAQYKRMMSERSVFVIDVVAIS